MQIKKGKRGVIRHLAITSAAGLFFWIIGEMFFSALTEKMWTPLGISLYFLFFTVIIAVLLIIFSISKVDAAKKENKKNITDGLAFGAILMAGIVLFSCLFEFLYELGGHDVSANTSYVFLIDDSGSMGGTEDVRINAIKEVMENDGGKNPYAVYRFSDNAELIKPMDYYNPGDEENMNFISYGGTEILKSIKTILDDIKTGKLDKAGTCPKILLVSDGGAYSFGLKNVTSKCVRNGISVSTIGVAGCNEGLLRKIADSTGGVFVYCDNVSQLSESLEQAKAVNTDRNLLSERFVFKNNGLYCFLRILFLFILGIAWSFAKASIFTDESVKWETVIIFSVICCTTAVLLLEFLSGTAISIKLLRLIFCVLWAVTYGTFGEKRNSKATFGNGESSFGNNNFSTNPHSDFDSLGKKDNNDVAVKGVNFNDFPLGSGEQKTDKSNPFNNNPLSGTSGPSNNGGFTSNPFNGTFGSSGGSGAASNPFNSTGSKNSGNPFDF